MELDEIVDAIGIEPYYREPAGVIFCDRCEAILPKIPRKSISLIITDPPYGIKKAGWDDKFPTTWIEGGFRVSDTIVCMSGQWALPKYLEQIGDRYIGIIAGHNKNGMTFSPIGFGNWIPAILAGKVRSRSQDAFAFVVRGKQNKHESQKPIEYMEKLTRLVSLKDDIILDPFLGSGTTAVAAKQLGRKYIGIEISEAYCKIGVQRLAQEELF